MATATVTQEWLSAVSAARRLGTTVYRLMKAAMAGQIRTQILPGSAPRFSAEDIDRLIAGRRQADEA